MTRTIHTAGLGLTALAAFSLIFFPARSARSEDAPTAAKPHPIEGAWKVVGYRDGVSEEYRKFPEKSELIQIITGGRFMWTEVYDGKVANVAGGTYTVEGDKFIEHMKYSAGNEVTRLLAGGTYEFSRKIEGNTWYKAGTIKVGGREIKSDLKFERCK